MHGKGVWQGMKRIFILLTAILLLVPALRITAEEPERMPAGFVRVTTATQTGWLPLPTDEEYTYPLIQILPDGTRTMNVIHLLPDGVYMESSTCDNQNCVHEGTVTLESRNGRVLGNAILCLPNQVSLELFSLEEVYSMTGAQQGGGESR